MDGNIYNTIEWASKVSMEGEVPFAEIVRTLLAAGVESYYADYRANRKTYYLPNGEAVTMELPAPLVRIAHAFDDAAVHAAVVGAQKGEVKYPYFLELTRFAGCVGYIVWLSGGHVTYFGRNGETLIEYFPK